MIRAELVGSGPLFDGTANRIIDRAVDQVEDAVAQRGVDDVRRYVRSKAQNPSGFYESRVVSDRAQGDRVIHDQNVVYGPWLAGVSRRNESTGYRGIRHWQVVGPRLDRQAPDIAEPILDRALGGM